MVLEQEAKLKKSKIMNKIMNSSQFEEKNEDKMYL